MTADLQAFENNQNFLEKNPFELLPSPSTLHNFPKQLQEVFAALGCFQTKGELLDVMGETYFQEKLVNAYFKILEKMNLV